MLVINLLNDRGTGRRKKKMLLLEICNLCHNHLLAVLVRNRVQGAESNCWHSPSRVLLALLGPVCTCTREPTCASESTCTMPPAARDPSFSPTSQCGSASQLTCEQLFSQSIMSTVEALCLPKKRATCQKCDAKKCPAPCHSVRPDLGSSHFMCERCHVRPCG